MSVFADLFASSTDPAGRGELSDFWYQPVGFVNDSGIVINSDTAMRLATVFACVRVISETVASLPLFVYRRISDNDKEKAKDHWLYKLLHSKPNYSQTSFSWREMQQGHLCLRGNAYSYIDRDKTGGIRNLIPWHPDKVTPRRMPDGTVQYEVRNANGTMDRRLAGEVLHIPALSFDGLKGINPIEYTAQSMSLAMAAEKHGAKFFKNGAKSTGVLSYPQPLSAEGRVNLRKAVEEQIAGENVFRPLIVEEGAKWEQMTIDPKSAQFLETRKFQDVDICKIFRVPPHLVGILDRATFSNIEHQSLEFVIHTIRPWLIRWEQAINDKLLDSSDEYFCEFKVDALLRGDTLSRYQAHNIGIQGGFLNRNEVRQMENLSPMPGLDKFMEPLNMAGVSASARGEKAQTDNFMLPIINNCAERIYNAEARELQKHQPRAKEDPDVYESWLREFYNKQNTYAAKTLLPLFGSESVEVAAKLQGGSAAAYAEIITKALENKEMNE